MQLRTRAGRGAIIGSAMVFALAAAACGSSATPAASTAVGTPAGTSSGGSPAANGTSVSIKNFAFSPATLTVSVGTTVTWTNNDTTGHNVKWSDGTATSQTMTTGSTYSRTFTAAGTYPYICGIHPTMQGTIVVQ